MVAISVDMSFVCVWRGVGIFFPLFLLTSTCFNLSLYRSTEKHVSIRVFERYLSHACEHRQEAKSTIRENCRHFFCESQTGKFLHPHFGSELTQTRVIILYLQARFYMWRLWSCVERCFFNCICFSLLSCCCFTNKSYNHIHFNCEFRSFSRWFFSSCDSSNPCKKVDKKPT